MRLFQCCSSTKWCCKLVFQCYHDMVSLCCGRPTNDDWKGLKRQTWPDAGKLETVERVKGPRATDANQPPSSSFLIHPSAAPEALPHCANQWPAATTNATATHIPPLDLAYCHVIRFYVIHSIHLDSFFFNSIFWFTSLSSLSGILCIQF